MRNGLNIAGVSELVHEIQTCPEEALIRLESIVRPLGAQVSETMIGTLTGGTVRVSRDFRFLTSHVSTQLGELPDYCDHILMALGGCVLVTFVQGCSARGFTIVDAEVDVTAAFHEDSTGRPRVDGIAYRYDINCDGPPEVLQEIAAIVTCLSPNHRTFIERGSLVLEVVGHDEQRTQRTLDHVARGEATANPGRRRVVVAWKYGTQLVARLENGSEHLVDQPKQYLGLDSAPNPQEYLLSAAGAELCRSLHPEGNKGERPIRDMRVRTAGSLNLLGITNVDDSVPVRVHDILMQVTLDADGDIEALADLVVGAAQCNSVLSLICEEHPIDVEVACRSKRVAKFTSDGARLQKELAVLAEAKRTAMKAAS